MFKPRQAPAATPATPPAIEVVRRRAKHRLIGASVLVLAGVVVFPVLFDTQPRPIPVDIPIEIPSRQVAKPLGKVVAAEPVGTDRSLSPHEDLVDSPSKPALPVETEPKAVADAAVTEPAAKKPNPPAPTPASPPPTPVLSAKESARAHALLEGRDAPVAAANTERFIVQVGAFADTALAQQTRLKLERAGLKTYTHVATTPDGKRTRVRMGPFASRSDADKAAAKAKGLGITAAILTL